MSKISFAIRELLILRASQIAVERATPSSSTSPFARTASIASRILDGGLQADLREAKAWVDSAIQTMRTCPDLPQGMTDEQIAHMILEKFRSRNPQDPRVALGIAKEKRTEDPQG